jgi:hypothetical protein
MPEQLYAFHLSSDPLISFHQMQLAPNSALLIVEQYFHSL